MFAVLAGATGYQPKNYTIERTTAVIYSGSDITITISNVDRPYYGTGNSYTVEVTDVSISGNHDVVIDEKYGDHTYTYSNQSRTGTVKLNINSITVTGTDIKDTDKLIFTYTVKRGYWTDTHTYEISISGLGLKES